MVAHDRLGGDDTTAARMSLRPDQGIGLVFSPEVKPGSVNYVIIVENFDTKIRKDYTVVSQSSR